MIRVRLPLRKKAAYGTVCSDRLLSFFYQRFNRMPVTKSAKKALRTATRRHEENVIQKAAFKKAVKEVKKAVEAGTDTVADLFSQAQSALDRAAKKHTIHPNKAARLKSRLAKHMATGPAVAVKKDAKASTPKKVVGAKKSAPKKVEAPKAEAAPKAAAPKKAPAKKAAPKKAA